MTLSTDQTESLRPGFEAFHRAEGWTDNMLIRMDNGEYQRNLQNRFIGWIAAKSSPVLVTPEMVEPCTTCHCHERAMKMLGDQTVGVYFPPQNYSTCKTCGTQLTLQFWDRPGGSPGNGYGPCPKCNPPTAALNPGGE